MDTPPLDLPSFEPGTVWLVGAGPGDPGLLTLLAWKALSEADVIVYDALVDDAVLAAARPAAVREYAGKRGGKPSPDQDDISSRLVELAQEGKRVLRLKGGDPLVYGRGVEECDALNAAGIRYRIVPGITAALGGLAYAGIPLTSRGTNTTVSFLTGVAAGGDVPEDIDWTALAHASPVLVIYMGTTHLAEIAEELMKAGRAGDEAVAVVSRATLADQSVLETTLAECRRAVAEARPKPPSLVVIGPIVELRSALQWWTPE